METMAKLEYLRLLPDEEVYRQSLPGCSSSAGEDFPGDDGEDLLLGEDDGTDYLGSKMSGIASARGGPLSQSQALPLLSGSLRLVTNLTNP